MNANPNWVRWVSASINKHFTTQLNSQLSVYIEGDDRRTANKSNYVELRYDGPHTNQLSPRLFKLTVTINALLSCKRDPANIYTYDALLGLLVSTFTNAITVYRYGNGPDDNQTELGCLKQLPDPSHNQIVVTRIGQSSPVLELHEATVEAGYEMLISV